MQITGGYLKSRKIDSPKGDNVRPTLSQIRESIFSSLFSIIDFEDKSFLDLFAGSGIMGFEAISRGFDSSCFLEKDKKTFFTLKSNSQKLGLSDEQVTIICADSIKFLKKLAQSFDVIYIDPPYQSGLYDSVLCEIVKNNILVPDGIIIAEHPKDLAIDLNHFELIKQKTYADKTITFLKLSSG
jgi:16S rRNA (guanine(966)-N(2))-methyltransferase RsmD